MKLPVYKHLFEINAGFDQVVRGLAALREDRHFLARELDRYSDLTKEARAATNSFLLAELELAETKDAGRRFRRRGKREHQEELGPTGTP